MKESVGRSKGRVVVTVAVPVVALVVLPLDVCVVEVREDEIHVVDHDHLLSAGMCINLFTILHSFNVYIK